MYFYVDYIGINFLRINSQLRVQMNLQIHLGYALYFTRLK